MSAKAGNFMLCEWLRVDLDIISGITVAETVCRTDFSPSVEVRSLVVLGVLVRSGGNLRVWSTVESLVGPSEVEAWEGWSKVEIWSKISGDYQFTGDSDVDDNVMLEIFYGDRFKMLVTDYYVFNLLNRSPTSYTCHQHILPRTSVTNIEVTMFTWTIMSTFTRKLFVYMKRLNIFRHNLENNVK